MIAARLAPLITLAFVSLLLAVVPARAADPTFPALNGRRVVDEAHILSPDDQAALTQKLADLETRTTDQLVVVTVPSLQNNGIEDFGYKLGRAWRIGQAGKNNGVILLVAPAEHKVRIEVGYGLEDVLTDALSSVILQEKVLPRFKDGDYAGGVDAGADAIIAQLTLDKGEALAQVKAASDKARNKAADDWIGWLFEIGVAVFVLAMVFLRHLIPRRYQPQWLSTGGGWSSGGGFSGGGGGFSGGGGSFGGGGASGSW
jgi:uncharacterized protein